MDKLKLRLVRLLPHHATLAEMLLVFLATFVLSSGQVLAVTRLQDRSLYINNNQSGATTDYKISFTYSTVTTIGSIDIRFCIDPIPYMPCVVPPGFDASQATLSSQTGETGYSILSQTTNHIILTRTPGVVGNTPSSYTFHNVVNPVQTGHSFAARLSDYASNDASGSFVDLGSVITQIADAVVLETQVPPMLIFCLGQQVSDDCQSVDGGNFTDMGTLSPEDTLKASSQMAVGTNASGGFVITVNGTSMQAGTHQITPMDVPAPSAPGSQQFGLNLRENASPVVGKDPDGASLNASPADDYNIPNLYKFVDGDIVASSPNVSLVRRFTVSYIVNSPPNLRAGVYTTTLTYICSGRF